VEDGLWNTTVQGQHSGLNRVRIRSGFRIATNLPEHWKKTTDLLEACIEL